jgi:hypothetical protein
VKRIREKVLFRLQQAEEQFHHFLKELDYAWRLLEEQPLSGLVNKYHPLEQEVVKPGETLAVPLSIAQKELAIQRMIQGRLESSPEKNTDFVIKTTTKAPENADEEIAKTLAVN